MVEVQYHTIPASENGTEPLGAHTYSVRILRRDHIDDWRWHPHVVARVVRFSEQYEPQANTSDLAVSIQQAFVLPDPALALMAFFRDEQLIGHMLIDRGTLYYRPIVRLHQYQIDHGVPPETRHESLRLLGEWARYAGPDGNREPARFIEALVQDKRLVPLYQRFFKAKPHLLLMRITVEEILP